MKKGTLLVGIALALVLAACGGGALSARDLLDQAAGKLAEAESVQFAIEREGPPVIIDPATGIAMLGATGAYQSPDSVHARVRVDARGMVAEAEVLWVAEGIFFKLPPLVASYQPIDLGDTFDAGDIFDAAVGLPAILRGLESPELVGEEDVDGITAYHITAQADGAEIAAVVGGAVQPGPATLDVWIAKDSGEVVRAVVTEESGDRWLIDLFAYGEPVEIPSP
jgi:hypothetical protein